MQMQMQKPSLLSDACCSSPSCQGAVRYVDEGPHLYLVVALYVHDRHGS